MGFRGKASSIAQIAFVVAPAFILFGYNQAGVGGLLSLSNWSKYAPCRKVVVQSNGQILVGLMDTKSYIFSIQKTGADGVKSKNLSPN